MRFKHNTSNAKVHLFIYKHVMHLFQNQLCYIIHYYKLGLSFDQKSGCYVYKVLTTILMTIS